MKKIDKIEIRVDPEFKQKILRYSEAHAQSVSEVVRTAIDASLEQEHKVEDIASADTPSPWRRTWQGAVFTGGVCLSAFLISSSFQSPALASAELRAAFAALDRNRDGVITREEYDVPHFIAGNSALMVSGVEVMAVDTVHVVEESAEAGQNEFSAQGVWIADGDLEVAELPEACRQMTVADEGQFGASLEQDFRRFDSDGDALLTFEEFEQSIVTDRLSEFGRWDADGDLLLSLDEFTEQHLSFPEDPCAEALGFDQTAFDSTELKGLLGFEFRLMDRDQDGWVTQQEYLSR